MANYDPSNLFAKILRGELPCHKVYEDDRAFAFLDIMPRAPGHTLVIPKAPARNILDVDPMISRTSPSSAEGRQGRHEGLQGRGVTMQQFSEPAGGQVVFHLHVHIIPRQTGVALKPPASFKEEPAVLSDQALRLAAREA